jgi:TonB family protein
MRKRTLVQILFLIALLAGVSAVGLAQDGDAPARERKITHRVTPAYPDLARQARLKGTVRLVAVVAPNGSVKETKPVGGNPVLLKSAAEAVLQWKFASAPAESKELVEIQFEPK